MNGGLSVGVFLQNSSAKICLIRRPIFGKRAKQKHYVAQSQTGLWGSNGAALPALFSDIARKIPGEALRPDCPTNISLPDPLVTEEQFVFRDFPTDQREAEALVSWRFGRDHQRDMGGLICSHQVLKTGKSDAVVLVRAMDARLVTKVSTAAKRAGFFVRRMDTWSGYLPTGGEGDNGVTVWSNGEWWSLICQTGNTTENLFRSGWCSNDQGEVDKISRLATAFALKSKLDRLPVSLIGKGSFQKRVSDIFSHQELFEISASGSAVDVDFTVAGNR